MESDIERFTLSGMIRYFAVATHLNLPSIAYFRIAGWQTPKETDIPNLKIFKMKAFQFIRMSVDSAVEKFSKELEIYLVESVNGTFKITERKDIQQHLVDKKITRILLVINPTEKELPVLK